MNCYKWWHTFYFYKSLNNDKKYGDDSTWTEQLENSQMKKARNTLVNNWIFVCNKHHTVFVPFAMHKMVDILFQSFCKLYLHTSQFILECNESKGSFESSNKEAKKKIFKWLAWIFTGQHAVAIKNHLYLFCDFLSFASYRYLRSILFSIFLRSIVLCVLRHSFISSSLLLL